jgi:transposase
VSGCGYEDRALGFTPDVRRILAYSQPVDLRKSLDGLVGLGKSVLDEDPLSGRLLVFGNRRGHDGKLVSGERTGWGWLAKRLEHGRLHWPQAEAKQELSRQVFPLLLAGIARGGRHCMC